jgi:hypothetical protein
LKSYLGTPLQDKQLHMNWCFPEEKENVRYPFMAVPWHKICLWFNATVASLHICSLEVSTVEALWNCPKEDINTLSHKLCNVEGWSFIKWNSKISCWKSGTVL